jgi:hydroxyacylglutathione hydrolase
VTSGKFATTIGYERRANPALRLDDAAAFAAYMNADQPRRPSNMTTIIRINQGLEPLAMGDPIVFETEPSAAAALVAGGMPIVDVRPTKAFGAAHAPGALNVQLGNGRFEQRVGWILPDPGTFLLAADDPASARRAAHKLAFVGLDARIGGWVSVARWQQAGLEVARLPQIDAWDLSRALEREGVSVLDVRVASEWVAGHIPAAHNTSLDRLDADLGTLPFGHDTPLAVVCDGGSASSTAASLLLRHGFRHVWNLDGGMKAWTAAGLPVLSGLELVSK